MNKPPAFQFYPDKWDSHTRHLSDGAYRTYHQIICWIWLHAPDLGSIPEAPEAIAVALAKPVETVTAHLDEILNPHMPLLRQENNRLYSGGLRKEYAKITKRRKSAKASADARWGNTEEVEKVCERIDNDDKTQCSPSPSPSPIPTPKRVVTLRDDDAPTMPLGLEIYSKHEPLRLLHTCPMLRGITLEQYLKAKQARSPHMDFLAATTEVVRRAEMDTDIRKPGVFLDCQLGYYEKDHLDQIQQRKIVAQELEKEITVMADSIVDLTASDHPSDKTLLSRLQAEFERLHGQKAYARAEEIANGKSDNERGPAK